MALDLKYFQLEDTQTVDENSLVVIECQNRGITIRGALQSDIQLDVSSKFGTIGGLGGSTGEKIKGFFETIKNIGSFINDASTALLGVSYTQPWQTRKIWKSTEPMKFTLNLVFSAWKNAKAEVYDPCIYLISLMYPRLYQGVVSGKNLIGGVFIPPGPSLIEGQDGASVSDAIDIKIGNMIQYRHVYIESVSVNFSKVFSGEGYPLSATAVVKISSTDTSYATYDGSFTLLEDQLNLSDYLVINDIKASEVLSRALDSLQQVYIDQAETQKDILGELTGWW